VAGGTETQDQTMFSLQFQMPPVGRITNSKSQSFTPVAMLTSYDLSKITLAHCKDAKNIIDPKLHQSQKSPV